MKNYKKHLIIIGLFIASALFGVLCSKSAFWVHVYVSGVFKDSYSSKTNLTREECEYLKYDFKKNPYRNTTTYWVYETDGFLQYKQPVEKEVITYHYKK